MSKQRVPWYKREISLSRVKREDVVTMTKNISVMLEAGLTVPESLAVLEEQANGSLKKILGEVSVEVQGGSSLADAISEHSKVFSPLFVSSVQIGESSGTLSKNLSHLSVQMERDLEIRRNIQGAMLYPGVVISAAVILGLALATFVLPQMASIFTSLNIDLPWTTRVMIWFAEVFRDHGAWLSPSILVCMFIIIAILRHPLVKPLVDRVTLKIPGVGTFVHNINRAQFCRSIGTMLQSGVPIQETLTVGSAVLPNTQYNRTVAKMAERIASGDGFAEIMEVYPNYYPKMVQRMVSVGERSGSLGNSLLFLAKFYEEKVGRQAKNMSTIIEPLLLIFIGLGVGFLAVAIFTPIYSVTGGLTI